MGANADHIAPNLTHSGIEPLRETLSRLEAGHRSDPGAMQRGAADALARAFGASDEPVSTAFSYGGAGLLAQHTCYFNGFAVVLKMPRGTALAIRTRDGEGIRIHVEPGPERPSAGQEALWHQAVESIARAYHVSAAGLDVALVSNIPPNCLEATLASLAAAMGAALAHLPGARIPDDPITVWLQSIESVIGAEFSRAFLLAARHPEHDAFIVIDTGTDETIPLDGPPRDQLCWGLIDAGRGAPRDIAFYQACGRQALEALALIRKSSGVPIASFRDIAHQDLVRLLGTLPRRLRPIVRHLVVENRRVYGLIGAIRRQDWQMLGGLLLMSHASVQSDWQGTDECVDFVVEEIRRLGAEGMYGACMTGRSGCVLVAGQPLAVPRAMAGLAQAFTERFGAPLRIWTF